MLDIMEKEESDRQTHPEDVSVPLCGDPP